MLRRITLVIIWILLSVGLLYVGCVKGQVIKQVKERDHGVYLSDSTYKKLVHRIELTYQIDSIKNLKIDNLEMQLRVKEKLYKELYFSDSLKTIRIYTLSDSVFKLVQKNKELIVQRERMWYAVLGLCIGFIFLVLK